MKTIVTSHPYPPIPLRSMDWQACFDGEEEDGPYGYGATETEAIEDLKRNRVQHWKRRANEGCAYWRINCQIRQVQRDWQTRFGTTNMELPKRFAVC